MSRRPVYIAAPLSPWIPPEQASRRWALSVVDNVARARRLAALCFQEDFAPVYVHDAVLRGVFGNDDDPVARAAGLEADLAIVTMIARASGEIWILQLPDRTRSKGCEAELAAYVKAGGGRIREWSFYKFGDDEHYTPVCVKTTGIVAPGVVSFGNPETARAWPDGRIPRGPRDACLGDGREVVRFRESTGVEYGANRCKSCHGTGVAS